MSTLEEKILDGPKVHYCEDGNDDIRHDEQDLEEDGNSKLESGRVDSLFRRTDENDDVRVSNYQINSSSSTSHNTGPKGVMEDFKKISQDNELEAEFQALMNDDSILKEYLSKRISQNTRTFGHVINLETGVELLDAIDKENPNVLVIVHIYTKFSRPCANLNRYLNELAVDMKTIKFVKLDASVTGLSQNFKDNGVPALLAYKGGELVKSIVQMNELLDRDFNASDVKEILIDNGLIGRIT